MSKIVRFIELNESQLNSLPVKAGSLIYTKDTMNQYFDTESGRIQVTNLIILENDSDRTDILVPLGEKVYYVKETKKIWIYDDEGLEWHCLNATIPVATTGSDGLMSAADKAKLDGIEANANNYIHPSGVTGGTFNSVEVNEYGHVVSGRAIDFAVNESGVITKNLTAKDATINIGTNELPIAEVFTTNFHSNGISNLQELVVAGNLTVKGNNFVVESTTVTTKDNIIQVNAGEVGPGVTAGFAGISVDRGTEDEYLIVFDESDDLFKVGMEGDLEVIASRPWVTEQLIDKLDATAISDWAKSPTKPTYTKEEIGLANVDNTADSEKNVASAAAIISGSWKIKVAEDGNLSFLYNDIPVATLSTTGTMTVSEIVEQ